MKSAYSLVYASLNPLSKEQVAIGLLLTNGKKAYFHFSAEKLSSIQKLFSPEARSMVRSYLEGLNSELSNTKLAEEGYINYLSDYKNNLIVFSKPVTIDLETSEENFKRLFEKFIFEYSHKQLVSHKNKINLTTTLKMKLYPNIKNHVNLNKVLTPKELPSLLVPNVKVNFVGRNENPVAGEAVDFELGINAVSNKILQFIGVIKAFEDNKEEKGKYFVIGDEPSKKAPEHHKTWQSLYKSKLVDVVPLNELDKITEYMRKHHVKPLQKK